MAVEQTRQHALAAAVHRMIAVQAVSHLGDPVIFHHDVGNFRGRPGAVEDHPALEYRSRHAAAPSLINSSRRL